MRENFFENRFDLLPKSRRTEAYRNVRPKSINPLITNALRKHPIHPACTIPSDYNLEIS